MDRGFPQVFKFVPRGTSGLNPHTNRDLVGRGINRLANGTSLNPEPNVPRGTIHAANYSSTFPRLALPKGSNCEVCVLWENQSRVSIIPSASLQ